MSKRFINTVNTRASVLPASSSASPFLLVRRCLSLSLSPSSIHHHRSSAPIPVPTAKPSPVTADSFIRQAIDIHTRAHLLTSHRAHMSSTAQSSSTSASASSASSSPPSTGPIESLLHERLTSAFHPIHLDVVNESYMHAVPRNSETHFKVTIVSSAFDGRTVLQRHRAVNAVVADELARPGGIHALSIVTRTPEQWEKDSSVHKSPACLGGSKHDPRRQQQA